jgi:hypothetical protein
VKPVEQDIPEICSPCLRQEPSMSLDFGVPRQELSMSLNLGVAYLVSSSIANSAKVVDGEIDSIALQVLTYVQGKHKP